MEHRCAIVPAFLGGYAAKCSCGWESRSRVWKEQAQGHADAHLAQQKETPSKKPMPSDHHVEVPAVAVELATKKFTDIHWHNAPLKYGGHARDTMRRALQAAAPSIRAEAERQVRWLLDRYRRLETLAGEFEARGRERNGLMSSEMGAADLRSIIADAHRYLDHPDTDVGVNARLDSIRQQAAQQERERIEAALLSDKAKQAAIAGLSARLGHTLNEAAVAVVLEKAFATLKEEDHG
ncbi:MAG TPA: hypothetical protein VI039_13105 [Solirubrobacterales bacterium]